MFLGTLVSPAYAFILQKWQCSFKDLFCLSAYLTTWLQVALDIGMWPWPHEHIWIPLMYLWHLTMIPIGLQFSKWVQYYIFSQYHILQQISDDLYEHGAFHATSMTTIWLKSREGMGKIWPTVNPAVAKSCFVLICFFKNINL